MKSSWRIGFSFGITSGIITTLGLMTGLYSSTNSKSIVLSGIIIIAIADALSDAMGIHMSQESNKRTSTKQIWEATIATFLTKSAFSLTFVIPFLFFRIKGAIISSFIWGSLLIILFSFYLNENRKEKPYRAIIEHLTLATVVIITTYFVGKLVAMI